MASPNRVLFEGSAAISLALVTSTLCSIVFVVNHHHHHHRRRLVARVAGVLESNPAFIKATVANLGDVTMNLIMNRTPRHQH